MQIKLSDHFTYGRLLRYTLPTIVMIIFTSLYSVVDGLFVSNLVGDLALSAVNIAFPITMIIGAFGFMLGTGGSAIVARTLGEGKPELASRYFTLFIWCVAGLGVVLSIVTIAFIEPIMRFAGASDLLLEDCIAYGRILPQCWATAWAVSSRWCTSCFPEERACGWCGRTFTAGNCFTPVSTAPRS